MRSIAVLATLDRHGNARRAGDAITVTEEKPRRHSGGCANGAVTSGADPRPW
jgi:hypothetical protein